MAENKPSLLPSSGTFGFFQQPPKLQNQLEDDVTLRRILNCKIMCMNTQRYLLTTRYSVHIVTTKRNDLT
jgi:hypothetical protein